MKPAPNDRQAFIREIFEGRVTADDINSLSSIKPADKKYLISLIPVGNISWVTHDPTERQKLFLSLTCLEAFFGGAAGGGKSDALLMAALQHVNTKGYAAIVFRRTYTDLALPEALMARAQEWLKQTPARWSDKDKTWTFPSGATLTFGYLETENDKYRYQSAAFQFIAFDEASQFSETQYTYLFSRLRRLANLDIPIRMRSASNPPPTPQHWLKDRFVPDGFTPEMASESSIFWKDGILPSGDTVHRAFVPSRLNDNPYLDQAEYEASLNELDAVTREQLLRGDWQIQQRGNVYPMWEDGVNGRHVITWSQFEAVFGSRHIPLHWLGAHGHDPGFDPDPRAAVWNFVAAKNGPLSGDIFCIRELYEHRMTVDDFAEAVKKAERPFMESSRITLRLIGHEASSEQATLTQKHKLSYQKLKPDANGGIAQMRHVLRITDFELKHPFKPQLEGRPHFYVVVDDDQLINPQNEKGMVNFRAEMAAYRYIEGNPSSQRGMPKIVPYDFFNHLMDAQRGIATRWFTRAAEKTPAEQMEDRLRPEIQMPAILEETHPDILLAKIQSRDLYLKRMQAEADKAARVRMTVPANVRFKR